MRLTHRSQYVDIVERKYFGSMACSEPLKVLPLLCPDAVLTGFFGSNVPRVVKHGASDGEESFEHFLGALQADFVLEYSEFVHFIDFETERLACTFRLKITPRDPADATGVRVLRNCNLFQFDNGLIKAVTAYFASPAIDVNPWSTIKSRGSPSTDTQSLPTG